jgi:ferredoxin, 2Fe-2S
MSVFVTFEQDGGSGLVASGASLWDAARRLGVGLHAVCKGAGECDGCAVQITRGADSLSPATEAELKTLGAERLLAGERLACQTILVKSVDVAARVVPPANPEASQSNKTLPFKQQVGTFIETEAKAITETVNMIRGKSHALVEKFLNLNQEKSGSTSQSSDKPPAS